MCPDHPSCKGWVWNTKLPAGHNELCHLCGNSYAETPKQPEGGSTEEEASVAIRGIYAELAAGDSDNIRLAELLAAKYPAAKGELPKKELSFSQKLAEASTDHSKAVRANEHCIGIVAALETKNAKAKED